MKTVVACGALALNVRRIARRRGWEVKVVPVPALLHNHPDRIGPAVAAVLASQVGGLAALGGYFMFDERLSRKRTLGVCTMLAGVAVLSALRA